MLEFVEEEGSRQGLVGSLNSVRKRDASSMSLVHVTQNVTDSQRHN